MFFYHIASVTISISSAVLSEWSVVSLFCSLQVFPPQSIQNSASFVSLFFFLSYPGHLCAAVTDAAGTGVGKLLRAFTRRPVNYGRSRGRGGGKEEEEEGEPSLYLSGVTGVTGLSCMSGAPVFNHRRDARRLFSAAASSLTPPRISRPICQLPVRPGC